MLMQTFAAGKIKIFERHDSTASRLSQIDDSAHAGIYTPDDAAKYSRRAPFRC